MKKLICITGMPGSGKAVVGGILKENGWPVIVMSGYIKKEMEKRNIKITSKTVREFASQIRKEQGMGVVAKLCLDDIKNQESDVVIVDGVRSLEEAALLKKEFGEKLVLVAVHASPKTRFERSKTREQGWDKKRMKDRESFLWRDEKELEYGQGNVIALADIIITNEGSIEELREKVEGIKLW